MKEYLVRVYEDRTEWRDSKTKEWHREDGPAVEWADGSKAWYRNGKWHREDGPAVEWVDGNKDWYIDGKSMTEEEFTNRNKRKIRVGSQTLELTVEQIEQLLKQVLKETEG